MIGSDYESQRKETRFLLAWNYIPLPLHVSHIKLFQKENLTEIIHQNPLWRQDSHMRPAHWLLLAQRPGPAQSPVGRWRVHPMPNIDAQRETPKRTTDIETFRILETTFWGNHSLITQFQLLYRDFYLTGAQGESIKCWRRGKCRQRNT